MLAGAALTLAACQGEKLSPLAERGRQVFVSQCTACHAFDRRRARSPSRSHRSGR